MKNFTYSLLFLFVVGAFLSSCKKDVTTEPEKDPVYTTVSLKFTSKANASDVQTITYKDMDGKGPLLPVFSTLRLKATSEYAVEVTSVKDESNNPTTDFLSTIKRDGKNYLFVYNVFQVNLGFTITDLDSNNKPLGVEAKANTGAQGNGNLTIKLLEILTSKSDTNPQGTLLVDYTFPVEVI